MVGRFDGVLIDFYGTICAGDREAVQRACTRIVETLGLSFTADEFAVLWGRRFFDVIDGSNGSGFRTLHECEVLSLEETLRGFGVRADAVPLVAELEAYWRNPPVYADAIEFLNQLTLPVCCVSNADTEPLWTAIEKHNLRFDAVVTSQAVRCYKPDIGIFRAALQRLGIRPERSVHIGDSLHSDVGGAVSAGIATVWVRRESRIHDIGTSEPSRTIRSLREIVGLFVA